MWQLASSTPSIACLLLERSKTSSLSMSFKASGSTPLTLVPDMILQQQQRQAAAQRMAPVQWLAQCPPQQEHSRWWVEVPAHAASIAAAQPLPCVQYLWEALCVLGEGSWAAIAEPAGARQLCFVGLAAGPLRRQAYSDVTRPSLQVRWRQGGEQGFSVYPAAARHTQQPSARATTPITKRPGCQACWWHPKPACQLGGSSVWYCPHLQRLPRRVFLTLLSQRLQPSA